MSARRSLYGQSLLRNSIAVGGQSTEPDDIYYKRVEVYPSKPAEDDAVKSPARNGNLDSNNNSGNNGISDKPAKAAKYNFKVVSWVADGSPYSSADCDENDVLNIKELINKHDEEIEKNLNLKQNLVSNDASGLSVADIRGAVGVEEGISGLSASTDEAAQRKTDTTLKDEFPKENGNEVGVKEPVVTTGPVDSKTSNGQPAEVDEAKPQGDSDTGDKIVED